MDARPDRQVARAKERLDAGDAYGAIHLLREVVATGKAFADAHHLLGLAYSMVGQREEALAEFDRALALNPRYVDAHLNRAVTLNDLGRSEEATAAFAAAQGLGAVDHTGFPAPVASQLANLHAELGEAYMEAGGMAQAILAARPGYDAARASLGLACYLLGDRAGARSAWEACRAKSPDDPKVVAYLALLERVGA